MLNVSRILVPLDLHEDADHNKLVATAVDMAQKNKAKLFLLNVVDVDLDSAMVDRFKNIKDEYVNMANGQLKDIVKNSIPDDVDAEFHVLSGRSYTKVIASAEDLDVDLILMTAHKSGMKDFLLGMTAARVVRHAKCSVLVIR